jgi:hypothetical protein
MVSKEDQTSLFALSLHWEAHYSIMITDGVWCATPLEAPVSVLTANSAYELRELLRADCANREARKRQRQLWQGSSL